MPNFWERRAKQKEIIAKSKRKIKMEVKAYKDALKENERACKNFLAAYKRENPEDFKRMNERCKREMAENRKWSKLVIAAKTAENKFFRLRECCLADTGQLSKSAHRTYKKAAEKMSETGVKLNAFLDNLEEKTTGWERQEQLEHGDLSFVSVGNFQRTTVQQVRERLRAAQPQQNAAVEPAREREEQDSVRILFAYNDEIENQDVENGLRESGDGAREERVVPGREHDLSDEQNHEIGEDEEPVVF